MWVFTNDVADNLGQNLIHFLVGMSHPRHDLRECCEPLPRGSAVAKYMLGIRENVPCMPEHCPLPDIWQYEFSQKRDAQLFLGSPHGLAKA